MSVSLTKKKLKQKNINNCTKKDKSTMLTNKPVKLNEPIINLLNKLANIMRNRNDYFRAHAYSKARDIISNINNPIYDTKELENLPRIGESIYDKIVTYIETGTLDILE